MGKILPTKRQKVIYIIIFFDTPV